MFGFDIGGGSAGTDRGRELAGWQDEWTNLRQERNQYDQLYPGATSTGQAGVNNLGDAGNFWKGVMTSTPAAAGVMAPEVNQTLAQSDASKAAAANMGTARTGGTAGDNQQRQMNTQSMIANAIFGARPQAAQQVGQVGAQQGQLGNEQMMTALRALGMSDADIQNIIGTSMASRGQNAALRQQNYSNIQNAVAGVVTGGMA